MEKVEGAKWRGSMLHNSTDLWKQQQNNLHFSLVVLINSSASSVINNSNVSSLLITLFLSTDSHL